MKTLLTLFVLLFSSSVVAGNDLTGKKLFCISNPEKAINYAFYFTSKDTVWFYMSDYSTEKTNKNHLFSKYEYTTSLKDIGLYTKDKTKIFIIERTTLDVKGTTAGLIVKGETCTILEDLDFNVPNDMYDYLDKVYKDQIREIKSKNKL